MGKYIGVMIQGEPGRVLPPHDRCRNREDIAKRLLSRRFQALSPDKTDPPIRACDHFDR
jgi:hypothetical protein